MPYFSGLHSRTVKTMSLYFIAVMPDEKIQKEVTAFKRYCQRHFGAEHALKSPPHITLIPPYRWREEQLPALRDVLDMFALGQTPFEVQLKDFDSFPPRVIFVNVVKNKQLDELHASLLRKMQAALDYHDQRAARFHPHMTIAHRDLSKTAYYKAWDYFSRQHYHRKFLVDKLVLLPHHDRRWHVEQEFFF